MNATQALTQALDEAEKSGQRIPCAGCPDGELWLSEDYREREIAAEFCTRCPVLELCRTAAEERRERWFTAGAVNWRSPKAQRERAQRNRERKAA